MVGELKNTAGELLQRGCISLSDAGIDGHILDARLLLQHVLGISHEQLVCNADMPIDEDRVAQYNEFIERRAGREPVSKIIGKKEFWKSEFIVTQDVLDPRPDSETLIEAVLSAMPDTKKEYRILDLGTGSGCLIISLLQEYCLASGVGADISEKAIEVAKCNAENIGVANRLELEISNWFSKVDGKFDLIISNPPYIAKSDIDNLMPEVANFDPHSALFAEDDGFADYAKIIPQAYDRLNKNGLLILELGIYQSERVEQIGRDCGFSQFVLRKDLAGVPRALLMYT